MEDIAPLYKILCLCLLFLVPLVPAFLLYIICPEDRFFAKGTFSGFKINSTGASAIYIVLLAAIYPKINFVISSIDDVKTMQSKIKNLKESMPWKIQYNLKLMTDSSHEINDGEYINYIRPDSILCYPSTIRFDPNTKQLTFYIENDIFKRMQGKVKGTLVLRNGFGTASFLAVPKKNQFENKLIEISNTYYKQTSDSYSGLRLNNIARIGHLNKSTALKNPPFITTRQ